MVHNSMTVFDLKTKSKGVSTKNCVLGRQSKNILRTPPLAKLKTPAPIRRTGQQGLGKIKIASTLNPFGKPVVSYTFQSPSGRSVTGNVSASKRRAESHIVRSQKEFDVVLENMIRKDETLVEDAADVLANMNIDTDSEQEEEEEMLLSGLVDLRIASTHVVDGEADMSEDNDGITGSHDEVPRRYIDEDYDAPAPLYSVSPPPAYNDAPHLHLDLEVAPSPALGISRTAQENGYEEFLRIEDEANRRVAPLGYKVVISPGDYTEIEDHPASVHIVSLWEQLIQLCDAFYLFPRLTFQSLETLSVEQGSWGHNREMLHIYPEQELLTPPASPIPTRQRARRTYDTVNSRRARTGDRSTRGAERY